MKIKKSKQLSRSFIANPFYDIPFIDRLKKCHAVDLRNNSVFIDCGHGYSAFRPIDKNKIFK